MRSRYSQPFDSISNSQRNGSISALHSKQRDAPRNTEQQTSEQHNDQAEGKEPTVQVPLGSQALSDDPNANDQSHSTRSVAQPGRTLYRPGS